MSREKGDITQLLLEWSQGDEGALERLMPVVYRELHKLAEIQLAGERPDHTLQPTALVNEAYLRLIDQTRIDWRNSLQFFGLAATMMRRVLVDHARSRSYGKREASAQAVSLEIVPELSKGDPADVLEVDDALTALAEFDKDLAKLVELRFFGGFSNEDIAQMMDISVPTVVRKWRTAKAWLYRQLGPDDER
jgi:RNA polymerase sigma factor (TIGR02999 family)